MAVLPENPRIVVLTGAGVSKESGLDTFRCEGGIWSKVNLEDVATPEAFAADPAYVHEFYNHRRRGLLDPAVQPNAAHFALARLQQALGENCMLVTQNIDDLHERAGSRPVHMHGELMKIRCDACKADPYSWSEDVSIDMICPDCGASGGLRPHVVWFGEVPLYMEQIMEALAQCDLFVSIGTSGAVYPAAGFVSLVRRAGRGRTLELNLDPSEGSAYFHESRLGPATELVPAFVEEVLGS